MPLVVFGLDALQNGAFDGVVALVEQLEKTLIRGGHGLAHHFYLTTFKQRLG